jgi:hypothetical protein
MLVPSVLALDLKSRTTSVEWADDFRLGSSEKIEGYEVNITFWHYPRS